MFDCQPKEVGSPCSAGDVLRCLDRHFEGHCLDSARKVKAINMTMRQWLSKRVISKLSFWWSMWSVCVPFANHSRFSKLDHSSPRNGKHIAGSFAKFLQNFGPPKRF